MTIASLPTETTFVAVVVAVVAVFIAGASRAVPPQDVPGWKRWSVPVGVIVFWLLVPAVLATRGSLDRYAPLPAPGAVLFLLLTAGTIALALSSFGARMATRIPLAALVGYQVFRAPLEWTLHQLFLEGVIPVQMTYSGRNFDVVTAILAVPLALMLRANRAPRWLVIAWNFIGLALLVNILAVAILSTPFPFRYFMNEPANLLPSTFPFVWLPTFLVQAALFGHLLVFRALRSPSPGHSGAAAAA